MHAAQTFMAFAFLRKRSGSEQRPKQPGRLLSSVNDDVHGGHMEGGSIVLSRELGGGSYPSRPAGEWMSEESGLRIVLQPTDLRGRQSGPTMVTTNSIAKPVVAAILSSRGLSGMLSVYSPDRTVAEGLFREAARSEPVEYGFSVGIFQSNLANFRARKSPSEDDGLPGPVCLFGDYLGDGTELDLPGNESRRMDYAWGFHLSGEGVVLSSDFGGTVHSACGFGDVPDGEFRAVIDAGAVDGSSGSRPMPTSGAIPRHIAVAICSDRVRQGVLSVYTLRREDALDLMSEALGGRRPAERPVGDSGLTSASRGGAENEPRVLFGRPPE